MTRDELISNARVALVALTAAERAALFKEVGSCMCSDAIRYATKNPGEALGALIGGLFGAALTSSAKAPATTTKVASEREQPCMACLFNQHTHALYLNGCCCEVQSHRR